MSTNGDFEMADTAIEDDAVTEYSFSSDSDIVDEIDVSDHGEDVITISSDSERGDQFTPSGVTDRPWREEHFGQEARRQYELMFSNIQQNAFGRDTEKIEDYLAQQDGQMELYLKDFPLTAWIIPQQQAQEAVRQLEQRKKWRQLGTRIFGDGRIPGVVPNGNGFASFRPQAIPLHTALNVPSSQYPRPASQGQQQMHHGAAYLPPHANTPPGMSQPHTHQVLRSQPNAQPIPTLPNGMPMYPPPGTNGFNGVARNGNNMQMHPETVYAPTQQKTITAQGSKGKGKKKDSAPIENPVTLAPPPRPPYPVQPKPDELKNANKSVRRNARPPPEDEVYPWNRDIDFLQARANAHWNDSIYDQATLDSMAATRRDNEVIINELENEESKRQRQNRSMQNTSSKAEGSSDAEKPQKHRGGRKPSAQDKTARVDGAGNDPYHSGHFKFADNASVAAAHQLGKHTPDEVMEAAEEGKITMDQCARLKICWNPGKKGNAAALEQAVFSIRDTVLTKQNLVMTPILTFRAAECLVDFCPDLLWNNNLLRVASEAGYGNKQIRDRMCQNGNYCDKATITKRIGAALGQKQQPGLVSKSYYNANMKDFGNYIDWFGYRTSHRGKMNVAGCKRKFGSDDLEETAESPAEEIVVSGVEEDGSEEMDAEDAVSVQSDTLLDEIED